MATNTAIISGGSLKPVAVNSAFVQGASLSQAGGTNTARVSGAMLMTATVEPFSTVRLPGDTTWTQTAGPATSTPNVLMPGVPNPGTTVTYKQPNNTTLSFKVLPHTIFGRDTNGTLYPIRRRPYQGTPLDAGPTQPTPTAFYDNSPTTMPTADMIVGSRRFVNVMHEDFNTDVPIGGFVAKSSSPGSGLLLPVNGTPNPYASTVMAYPSGFGASYTGTNRPEKVLSASNSCLNMNFSIDPANGEVLCATVHYLVGTGDHGGTWYPGYQVDPTVGGRFMFRFRVVNGDMLAGWGAVSQLIASDADWSAMHGEMDMNEGSIGTGNIMQTNWHQYQSANTFAPWSNSIAWGSGWHNTCYDWIPVGDPLEPAGRETVWIDGVKVGESLGDRIAQNWRAFFAFQTGGNNTPPPPAGTVNPYGGFYPADGQTRGQLQIDWVSVYRPTVVDAETIPGAPTNVVATPSNASASVAFTPSTTGATTAPGAPTSITATAGNGAATVSFTAPANNGGSAITTYTVTASPGGATATGPSSPITVTGLTNGVAYTFTVQASNTAGTGPASTASTPVTPAAPVIVPGAPTGLSATAGSASALVAFTAPSSNGGATITSYTVTSSPGGLTASGSASPITVSGLTNGTAYTFTAKATNSAGAGPASSASAAVTPAAAATQEYSGFGSTVPAGLNWANDSSAISVGLMFKTSLTGQTSTGCRFYVASNSTGSLTGAVGYLYAVSGYPSGTPLATANFGALTRGAWNQVHWNGVALTAGTTYCVAVWDGGSNYSAIANYFTAGDVAAPSGASGLTFPQDGANHNGVYGVGAVGTVPNATFGAGYYGLDALVAGVPTTASAPGAPTNVVATAAAGSATVTFNPPFSDGGAAISGYTVTSSPGGFTATAASSPVSIGGLTNGTAYTFTVKATNSAGVGPASSASAAVTPTATAAVAVSHGQQLTTSIVGLTGLGVSAGQLETMAVPSRGYWRTDTPADWSPSSTYVYNNVVTNKGGIVTAGGMVIDGYTIPAGTRVVQFRDFSAGDFYVSSGQNFVMRGCRIRNGVKAPGNFNCASGQTSMIWIGYCDMGGLGAADAQYNEIPIKITDAGGGAIYRNYLTYTTTAIQVAANNFDVTENYVDKLTPYYGDNIPPGESTPKHVNGFTTNGGLLNIRIMRNRFTGPSPDDAGRSVNQTDCISFFQDFSDYPGTGTNSDGTVGYQVKDNFLGGTGYCVYAGMNAGKPTTSVNNLALSGNKITTQWYATGGAFGAITAEPVWGSQGNVKSNNTWADGANAGATW